MGPERADQGGSILYGGGWRDGDPPKLDPPKPKPPKPDPPAMPDTNRPADFKAAIPSTAPAAGGQGGATDGAIKNKEEKENQALAAAKTEHDMMAVRVDALDKELADLHNQLAAEKKKQAKGSYRLAALRARLTAELAQQEAGREAEREQWEAERAQLEAQLAQLQAQNQPQKLVVTAGDFSGIVASVDVCPMAIYGPWSATPEQAVSVRVTTLLDALTAASQHTGSPLGQAVPLPGETQAPADAAEQGVPEEAQQGGAEGTSAEGGAASGVGSQDGPASEAASQDGAASGAASQGGTASGAASQGGQGTTLEGIAAGQGNSFAAMTGEGELDVELLAGFLLGGRVVDELLPGPEASGEGADSDGEE